MAERETAPRRSASVLLVEDDPAQRHGIARALTTVGHQVEAVGDGAVAIDLLAQRSFDFVITDLRLPSADGLQVLAASKRQNPAAPVIVVTGAGDVTTAVAAMRGGASDYIQKPFTLHELRARFERLQEEQRLRQELAYLRHEQPEIYRFEGIIGSSGALASVFDIVRKVARSDTTVLIRGETGTGKELIAGAIHHNSARANAAFVKTNCAALHENLLESELFGHEQGAFTGAVATRVGRFEQADRGTLFLDEVGDMSAATQGKVLRAIQEGEFERLGGTRTRQVNVRLVAATHRDLAAMVEAGSFRADLYYRLSVVVIHIPPLRERKEDIPELAQYFLQQMAHAAKSTVKGISPAALKLLRRYTWPGNIRELRNVIERAVLMTDTREIRPEDLSFGEAFAGPDPRTGSTVVRIPPQGVPLADIERQALMEALKICGGVQKDAAELLHISPRVLNYKLKALGIARPVDRPSKERPGS